MKRSPRILLALAGLGLVFGVIEFTPRAANSGAEKMESEKLPQAEPAKIAVGSCGDEASGAGVRHSRALLYLLR